VKWLTPGGVVASAAVGAAVAWGAGGGIPGLVLLVTFFVTGSVLTQISGGSGGRRTVRQVVANGGVAAAAALFGSWAGAAGALAAATADTWATEIGSFSSTPPRLLTTGQPVPAGTSGGVTLLGTAGGVTGAIVIGALAGGLGPAGWSVAWTTAAAGVIGMLSDSVLGATVQEKRHWLDNDGVNLAATSLGGGVGVLLSFITR
jgi:uncharacterized protein (TIGR00297 family)